MQKYLLPRLSENRPVTVVMAFCAMLVVGWIAYERIPLALEPMGEATSTLWAWIPFPNATAAQTLEEIVIPLEDALYGLTGFKGTRAFAQRERGSSYVDYHKGTDMDLAWQDLRERMDRFHAELDHDATMKRRKINVGWIDLGDESFNVMWINARFDRSILRPDLLLEQTIKPAILRIDGVASVSVWSGRDLELWIVLDEGKIRSLGVDLVNRLRREGMRRTDALLQAGRHRFRPILMTTFTTVFGLVPMAVGNPNVVGTDYAPLGRTMMGGLLASMMLTLLVVPLCYTFFDDLREVVSKAVRSGRRKSSPRVASV